MEVNEYKAEAFNGPNVEDFRRKWGSHLNGWEINLLLCQHLTNNFDYQLVNLNKVSDVKDDIIKDLKALDLSSEIFQELYEDTIKSFYQNNGGKMGEFYTPDTIKQLYHRIARCYREFSEWEKVYDPTAGTGGLLAAIPGKSVYMGTEIRMEVSYLANMFLKHTFKDKVVDIAHGDALERLILGEERADIVVANPPFGIKWKPNSEVNKYFQASGVGLDFGGILPYPASADYAFIKHMINSVKDNGLIITLIFPGILYKVNRHAKIREWLLNNNMIEAIIQLPAEIFKHTTIATCLLILKKKREQTRVLFADLSHCHTRVNKMRVITQEAVDELILQYEHYVQGGDMPEISKERIKQGLPLLRTVDLDSLKHNDPDITLSVSTFINIEETDEIPYTPEIDGAYETLKFINRLKQQLEINREIKSLFNDTDKISDLAAEEIAPHIFGFYERHHDLIEKIIAQKKELIKQRAIAKGIKVNN